MNPSDPLANLRDIHLPPEIGWWPLAPGWWVLAALVFALLVLAIIWLRKRSQANNYRREALKQLDLALASATGHQQAQALLALLRRTAQTARQSTHPASLATADFLRLLQRNCDKPVFQQIPENIDALLYSPISEARNDRLDALVEDARTWIKYHRRGLAC